MTDDTYNGWTNKPTWLVHLWLTNEEGTYDYARHLVATHDRYDGANALRDYVDEILGIDSGLAADLIGWCLAVVNWREVYEAFTDE